MSAEEIHEALEKLEELSAAFVMADVSDLQALARIHTHYQDLEKLTAHPHLQTTARKCAQLTEQVILEERDGAESMRILADSITDMKKFLCDYQNSDYSSGPSETEKAAALPQISSDDEIFITFLSRQESVMEELEEEILSLEKGTEPGKIRRIFHTLKGEAGALSLGDVEKLCHATEDYLESAQTNRSVEVLLKVKDWLNDTFSAYSGKCDPPGEVDGILSYLEYNEQSGLDLKVRDKQDSGSSGKGVSESNAGKEVVLSETVGDTSLLEDFVCESRDHLEQADDCLLRIESSPEDRDLINELFRVFHTIKGIAGFLSLSAIQSLAHSAENLLSNARDGSIELTEQRMEFLFLSVDTLKGEIESVQHALTGNGKYRSQDTIESLIRTMDHLAEGNSEKRPKIGEVLIGQGKVTPGDVAKALSDQQQKPDVRMGELLMDRGVVSPREINKALSVQSAKQKTVRVKEKIKVDTEKLDHLVDYIGELVITEAMVTGDKELKENLSPRAERNLRQLDKITRQLQEIGLSMRMVSLKTTFQKMARLVRDLANKSGKKIRFITAGEDTELDKSVIENIGDPLVHMVRNSADHGIETVQERLQSGKPEAGTVHLRAYQKNGSICIEVEDDGKGLDPDAILKKAQDRNLIDASETRSEQEIYQLIFHPGFSTAAKVTDVSGRGVGMDVVKRNVEALKGRISIRSKKGAGTVFTIHLPLTLAIMDGMVVTVGEERYIIPIVSVIESFRPEKENISTAMKNGEMVSSHGALIPVRRLSEEFGVSGAVSDFTEGIIIITEDKARRIGLLVDTIVGQQQTVIKNVGGGIGNVRGIAGAAIMPDGQVSLILDVAALIRDNDGGDIWDESADK